MKLLNTVWSLVLASMMFGCTSNSAKKTSDEEMLPQDWDALVAQARGKTVTWAMWQGDPFINDYVANYVTKKLKSKYDITLRTVSTQGNDMVTAMMTELEANKTHSEFDMLWINGETFFQLRQINALHGPFTDGLPNANSIDFNNPFIAFDFQQRVDGYECPWGNVQLALIYDTERVATPPKDPKSLEAWVKKNPGRFTFDSSFLGMTFLKSLLIHFAGSKDALHGPFKDATYKTASAKLWNYLEGIRPYLWKKGETFPTRPAQLHQLFVAGEIDFTMSSNDGDVDNKVLQGLFPKSAKSYVLETGTIQNTHYIGIAARSAQKAAALVATNFLISPEAQFEKAKPAIWGDGTILDIARLPKAWADKFNAIPDRKHAPPRKAIQPFALQEPAPEYMLKITKDFRNRIIEG